MGNASCTTSCLAPMAGVPDDRFGIEAVGKVLPGLGGRLDGMAMRVSVIDGSIADLTAALGEQAGAEQVDPMAGDRAMGELGDGTAERRR